MRSMAASGTIMKPSLSAETSAQNESSHVSLSLVGSALPRSQQRVSTGVISNASGAPHRLAATARRSSKNRSGSVVSGGWLFASGRDPATGTLGRECPLLDMAVLLFDNGTPTTLWGSCCSNPGIIQRFAAGLL